MSQELLTAIKSLERDIKEMRKDISHLNVTVGKMEEALASFKEQYTSEVTSNIKTWNATSENQNKVVWIVVGGVVAAVMTIIGIQ